jgi:hypothetical protein
VQRAGATEHGTVVVTRVVQVGSIKISTHPYIQFVGRSVTVVVVHELSGGSGRDGRGCRRISPEAVGAGAGEAALQLPISKVLKRFTIEAKQLRHMIIDKVVRCHV